MRGWQRTFRLRLLLSALALILSCAPIIAGPNEDLITRWYVLLARADSPGLAALLADDARIHLGDIGVDQTKSEFLGSMGEWAQAVAGATIRYKVESTTDAVTTVLACYDFPSNEILIREVFAIREGRIVENTQTTVAEACENY